MTTVIIINIANKVEIINICTRTYIKIWKNVSYITVSVTFINRMLLNNTFLIGNMAFKCSLFLFQFARHVNKVMISCHLQPSFNKLQRGKYFQILLKL